MAIDTISIIPQETYVSSHPGVLQVHFTSGEYNSSLHAVKSFTAGEFICSLQAERWTPAPCSLATLQCAEKEHYELNSDLAFTNHSCDPSVGFDLSSPNRHDWRVVALKNIEPGDPITFFYPSTEWDAWNGGFRCGCGSKGCIGTYKGAKVLPREVLQGYQYISSHIWRLVDIRDAKNIA